MGGSVRCDGDPVPKAVRHVEGGDDLGGDPIEKGVHPFIPLLLGWLDVLQEIGFFHHLLDATPLKSNEGDDKDCAGEEDPIANQRRRGGCHLERVASLILFFSIQEKKVCILQVVSE